jgi:predicted alpha/beta superfamily hydrolase
MDAPTPEQSAITTPPGRDPSIVGDLRLHEFPSRIFHNQRLLRIWLPPRYDADENQNRRYPVFYLNDGQNLFDSSTSFTGVEWQIDQTADRLIRQEVIRPMIFVGIDNAREQRLREYLPYRSISPAVLRPLGVRYPDFLAREVMPFVAQRYRVARGPENTGLGGSSLGGLISLYAALNMPGIFGHLLLESPSLWVANRRILRESRNIRDWPEKIFLAVGTHEVGRDDKDRETVESVRQLASIMRRSGLDDQRLLLDIDEGATHSEVAWAKRFPQALEFLFETLPEFTDQEPSQE